MTQTMADCCQVNRNIASQTEGNHYSTVAPLSWKTLGFDTAANTQQQLDGQVSVAHQTKQTGGQ